MKGIRLSLLVVACVVLFCGCQVHTRVQTENPSTLPENWEALVKEKMKGLTPLGSAEQVVVRGTPERCTGSFETRQYGYCGKVNIIGGQPKSYFLSETGVVWLKTINGLETLP